MVDAAILLVALLAVGGPLTCWSNRGRRTEWFVAAFEAAALGLVVSIPVAIWAVRVDRFDLPTLGLATLPVVVLGVGLCVRDRRSLRWPTVPTWSLLLVPVLAGAWVLRAAPSNFVFQVADMGEYVNSANVLAETGHLVRGFPHGFTVFLGVTHLGSGSGSGGTVAGLPVLGLLTVLGVASVGRSLRLHPAAVVAVATLVALHPHAVWFARLPVSEALYAVLLLALLHAVVRAARSGSRSIAAVAGLVPGVLLLVRGNALLLAGVLALVLVATAVLGTAREHRAARWVVGVGLASSAGAYAYDVWYPRPYFVGNQLGGILPARVFQRAESLGLLEVSWALGAVSVAGLGALLLGASAARRAVRVPPGRRPSVRTGLLLVLVVVGVVAALAMGLDGLVDAASRWGAVTLLLATAGAVLVVADREPRLPLPAAVFVVGVVATFAVLFARRLPEARPAVFFLYWDRYLYSEVLPLLFVLAGVALHAVVVRVERAPLLARRVGVAGLVLLGTVAVLEVGPTTREITRARLLGDAHGTLRAVDDLARSQGGGPIVFAGPEQVPDGWFFPNTHRAFGLPLVQTAGRQVLNLPSDPFGADPRPPAREVVDLLADRDVARGYLVVVDDCRPRCAGPPARYARAPGFGEVGHVVHVAHVVPRSLDRGEERFASVRVRVDVLAVDVAAARAAGLDPSP